MVKRAGFYLSLLNIIFFVAGAAAGVVAGLLLACNREYGALLGGGIFFLPLAILLMGMGLLLLALLAWVGVLHASACLLYTYAGLLVVAAATEVVAGTLVLLYRERTEEVVQRAVAKVFRGYGEEDNLAVTFSLDRAQHKLQCCGVINFVEWDNTTHGLQYGDVPDSCCRNLKEGCGQGILLLPDFYAKKAVHPRGCYTTVRGQVARGTPAIITMFVILILVQLMCVYYAFSAARKLRMTVAPA